MTVLKTSLKSREQEASKKTDPPVVGPASGFALLRRDKLREEVGGSGTVGTKRRRKEGGKAES